MTSRIAFAGTPDLAATILTSLLDAGSRPVAVLTQPDRPAGRGRKLRPSPVKEVAEATGLPVLQPVSLKSAEAQSLIADLDLDLLLVAAYGLILPQAVLDMPRLGCVNVHASLLPRWRGAAPIQRAIIAGDEQTGVTLMQMDAGLDTGAMLTTATCAIAERETGGSLHDKLADLGAELLTRSMSGLLTGQFTPVPQDDEQSSYAARIEKSEGRIDWASPAADIERKVRAFNPWPVTYCEIETPAGSTAPGTKPLSGRLRIWDARVTGADSDSPPGTVLSSAPGKLHVSTGRGILAIEELQAAGAKRLSAREFLNARDVPAGTRFAMAD